MSEFTPNSTMKEVETRYPFARALLHSKFHVGGCSSCGFEPHESIQQVAAKHGKDSEAMLECLNTGLEDLGRAEVSVDAAQILLKQKNVLVVDVRELWEFELCRLSNEVIHLSEKTMPLIFEKGAEAKSVLIYCHHGVRSLNAALYFRQNGLPNAVSLKGGIDRYSQIIDPSIIRY